MYVIQCKCRKYRTGQDATFYIGEYHHEKDVEKAKTFETEEQAQKIINDWGLDPKLFKVVDKEKCRND